MLVDGMGIPDLVVSSYVTTTLRHRHMSYSRMSQRLRGIERGLRLVATLGIDIDQRLSDGTFLTHIELAALSSACLARDDGDGMIGSPAAGAYFGAFIDYLLWLAERPRLRADRPTKIHLFKAAERFEKAAEQYGPEPGTGAVNPDERHGLDPRQRELFLKVIRPDASGNPFAPKLRKRNYAFLLVAYFLGLRAGEELGIKRDDYDGRSVERSLTIRRRSSDPEDDRSTPALVKTLGRTLPLDDEIAEALNEWLLQRNLRKGRMSFPDSVRRSSFIFVSTQGNPLSLRAGRAIFQTLADRHPLLKDICQHVLRHDDSERWIEENGTGEQSQTNHRFKKGWSERSKMPAKYGRREVAKQTGRKIRTMTREALGGLATDDTSK